MGMNVYNNKYIKILCGFLNFKRFTYQLSNSWITLIYFDFLIIVVIDSIKIFVQHQMVVQVIYLFYIELIIVLNQ